MPEKEAPLREGYRSLSVAESNSNQFGMIFVYNPISKDKTEIHIHNYGRAE